MFGPAFPYEVGILYRGGKINGQQVYTQPGGPGTPVVPLPPQQYPGHDEGYPQIPFAYFGFLLMGCGHWINSCEVNQVYDPYTGMQAALLCCPICGYIQEIVEPATDWWDKWYSLYALGNGTGVFN